MPTYEFHDNKIETPEDCLMVKLDGDKLGTIASFYKKIQKKLKLPEYFGQNLDALEESMNDLAWINDTLVFINIKNGSKIGIDDDPDFNIRLKTLFQDVIDDENASVGIIICWRP